MSKCHFWKLFFHWEWVWCCVFLRSCAKINCIRGDHVVKISKCIQTISKCSSCEMLPVGICTQLLQGLQVLCRFFCVSPTGECHNWQHGFYRWRGSRSRATEKRPDTTKVSKTRKAKHSKSKASKTNINKHNYRTPFFWISGFAFAGILTSQESRLRSPYLRGFGTFKSSSFKVFWPSKLGISELTFKTWSFEQFKAVSFKTWSLPDCQNSEFSTNQLQWQWTHFANNPFI